MSERTYNTRDNGDDFPSPTVQGIECLIKKIVVNNDGTVALSIDMMAVTDEAIDQIKGMIHLQRGKCSLSLAGMQGELPL